MHFKRIIKKIIAFCTDSPFAYEANDIKDMKLVKIYDHAKDYYYSMAVNCPKKLSMLLAKRDIQTFYNDTEKINKLYDCIRKEG